MQTAEPASTRDATDRLVKILDNTYAQSDLNQAANNATQLNAEERTQLLRLLGGFEELFGGTLGDWDTETVKLELNPDSEPFNSKYYLVPRITEENFRKELKQLVKIGVLTTVPQSQYGTYLLYLRRKGLRGL